MALVPIRTQQQIVGLLQLNDRRKDRFTLATIQALEGIAAHLGEAPMRKQVEEVLVQSEERYRAFVANSSEGIWRYEGDEPISTTLPVEEQIERFFQHGYMAECNDALARMYGFDRADEMIGLRLKDLTADDPRNLEHLRVFVQSGYRMVDAESLAKDRDGQTHHFLNSCVGVVESGHLVRAWGVQREITDRKQAEEALRESETRYRSLFSTIVDGVFVVGPDGRIDEVNDPACAQLGYGHDELIGMPVSAVSGRSGFNFEDAWDGLRSQGSLSYETSHRRKDGGIVPVELSITVAEHKGKSAILGVARDITERKRSEDLMRIQRDLAVKLGSVDDLEEGSDLCVRAVLEASGLDCGAIYLRDEPSGGLDLLCQVGLSDDFVARVHHFERETVNTQSVMVGKPVYATFEKLDVPLDETMMREGLLATAIIPIVHRNQVIGCLNAASHRLVDVPTYSRSALETIASQIGGTIVRLKAEEQVRRDHELLARIADTSPAGITVVDRDGQLKFANPVAERILGLTRDQIVQRTYNAPAWHITDYDGGPFPEEQLPFRQVMATGRPVHDVRHAIEWPDGRRVLLSINAAPLVDEAGQSGGMVATIQDVTEQVGAEEALRASEARFRSIVQGSPMGMHMYQLEPDGRLVFTGANPAADTILGVDNRQFIGKTIEEAFPPLADTEVPERYRRAAGEGRPWNTEQIDYEYGQIKGAYEVHAFGTAPGKVAVMFLDVTERKRAEEALRESTARLQSVFDSSPLAITVTDWDGSITDCSQAALNTYRLVSKAEVIGRSVFGFVAEKDRAAAEARMAELLHVGSIQDAEYTLVRRDGTEFPGELSASLMRDHDGRPLGLVGISADITERKKAEQERLDYQRRLRSLASELSLAEERERRRIAMDLHDHACQTLVLSKMRLQGLRKSVSSGNPDDVADVCRALDRTIENVRELTFDLSSPTLYRFGLENALEELLEDKLAEHGIHCTFRDDDAPKPLAQDVRILLFQSVRELLINTIKHARAREVSLDIARSDDSIRITVTDDGVGFDANDVLAAPSRSRGFGLFNIRERLDYIGGNLEMESRPGRGSRFTLVARLQSEGDAAKETQDGHHDSTG